MNENYSGSCLLGAVTGDIIGSVYEFMSWKKYDFPLFSDRSKITDDSVLTLAVADGILHQSEYMDIIRSYALRYPNKGYGGLFRTWMRATDPKPYNSFGNGSAMRVSAVGWAFETVEAVLEEAKRSAEVTHNHPEGIKGAQAAALGVFLARKGADKAEIKQQMETRFGYDLHLSVDEIRPDYKFNEICQDTVPQALCAFLDSDDFEDAIRKAVSLGGDADTLAAICGGIAEAYYGGVPERIAQEARKRILPELWRVIEDFNARFGGGVERASGASGS